MILENCGCECTKIRLLIGDTNAKEKNVMGAAFRHIQRGSVAFIGPEASKLTVLVSTWLSVPSIDRAIIGYAATSPQLSESEFSNFVRTPPSDNEHAKLMAKLMRGLVRYLCTENIAVYPIRFDCTRHTLESTSCFFLCRQIQVEMCKCIGGCWRFVFDRRRRRLRGSSN